MSWVPLRIPTRHQFSTHLSCNLFVDSADPAHVLVRALTFTFFNTHRFCILKSTAGSRDQISRTESPTSGRTILGTAGTGEIYVAEGVGKAVAGRPGTSEKRTTKRRKARPRAFSARASIWCVYSGSDSAFVFRVASAGLTQGEPGGGKKKSSKTPDDGGEKEVNRGEGVDNSRIKKPRKTRKVPAGGTGRARPRKMTIVDVALAAAQKKREAKLKARGLLKTARGLVVKGRWNR